MKKLIITLVFLFSASLQVEAQKILEQELSGFNNPEELVTLSQTIPFDQAIEVLNKVSEKTTGKRIVTTTGSTDPIGIEIEKMHYLKALVIITQFRNFVFEEREDVIVVKNKGEVEEELGEDVYASVDEREVKISAIFFEANITEIRERGIDWNLLLSQTGLTIGSTFRTLSEATEGDETGGEGGGSGEQNPPDFNINTSTEFDVGDLKGNATAMFRFFESENLGEIIAQPTVTVRNRQLGRIQIGSDISIKQRDFAGNVIDVFISTGTIIEVTPHMYSEDDIDYVLLKLNVERSSAQPTTLTTEIRKTRATTDVLMLDGEETVIGGLFVNDVSDVRRGIPILKDLPWWVLGIRYLAGYDQKTIKKSEVIILIKAEIVPTLKERVAQKKENVLEKERLRNMKMLEKYGQDYKKEKNDEEDEGENEEK